VEFSASTMLQYRGKLRVKDLNLPIEPAGVFWRSRLHTVVAKEEVQWWSQRRSRANTPQASTRGTPRKRWLRYPPSATTGC